MLNFLYYHFTFPLVIVLILHVAATYWGHHRTSVNLASLADKYGFEINHPRPFLGLFSRTPTITGRYRARDLQLFRYWNGGNSENHGSRIALVTSTKGDTKFHFEIAWNNLSERLNKSVRPRPMWPGDATIQKIQREEFEKQKESHAGIGISKVHFSFGANPKLQISPTGDAAFDEAYLIKTNDPEAAKALLTSNIRSQFSLLREQRHTQHIFLIDQGDVFCSVRGDFSSRRSMERLTGDLDLLCDLAEQAEKFPG